MHLVYFVIHNRDGLHTVALAYCYPGIASSDKSESDRNRVASHLVADAAGKKREAGLPIHTIVGTVLLEPSENIVSSRVKHYRAHCQPHGS